MNMNNPTFITNNNNRQSNINLIQSHNLNVNLSSNQSIDQLMFKKH
jgi:hypothetical protein